MKRLLPLMVLVALGASCVSPPPDRVKLTSLPDRVRVEIDGQLFTEYIFADAARRPYCYPILASDGTQLVRDFPMKETPGEDKDHPHHRGLWFAHSAAQGVDFWNDPGAGSAASDKKGRIVHDRLVEVRGGAVGVIRATERWVAPDDSVSCTADTTLRFFATDAGRFVDCETTLHAPANKPLLLGDNKDGTMAIRLAQWMTMAHTVKSTDAAGKPIETKYPGVGHYVLSTGERDAAAWGKRADWADSFAPRNDKTYGIAIFDHPKNLRHPTWWMARDYGLFGANPFGQHDFEALKDKPHAGDYTVPAGGSLTLRYRFYFHMGDEKAANVAAHYADYAAGK